jgi:hypothetical protein
VLDVDLARRMLMLLWARGCPQQPSFRPDPEPRRNPQHSSFRPDPERKRRGRGEPAPSAVEGSLLFCRAAKAGFSTRAKALVEMTNNKRDAKVLSQLTPKQPSFRPNPERMRRASGETAPSVVEGNLLLHPS